jgi:hypothetical protein
MAARKIGEILTQEDLDAAWDDVAQAVLEADRRREKRRRYQVCAGALMLALGFWALVLRQ